MVYRDFKKKYGDLSPLNQKVVMGTVRRLSHSGKQMQINIEFFDKISKARKETRIGYEELYRKLQEKCNNSVSRKTYEAFLSRKSSKSSLFEPVCEILGISNKEIKDIQNSFIIQCKYLNDSRWLYESLSERDKQAMDYLVNALYMAEHSPEIFEEDGEDRSLL